jgi:hypothetical protein
MHFDIPRHTLLQRSSGKIVAIGGATMPWERFP